jgi:hypothetical protein
MTHTPTAFAAAVFVRHLSLHQSRHCYCCCCSTDNTLSCTMVSFNGSIERMQQKGEDHGWMHMTDIGFVLNQSFALSRVFLEQRLVGTEFYVPATYAPVIFIDPHITHLISFLGFSLSLSISPSIIMTTGTRTTKHSRVQTHLGGRRWRRQDEVCQASFDG